MEKDYTLNKEDLTASSPRLIIKGLSKEKKNALLTGALGIGGVITGWGLFKLFGHNINSNNAAFLTADSTDGSEDVLNESSLADAPHLADEEHVVVNADLPFSIADTDELSFGEAFSSAREELGSGGFFEWRGSTYNTYYKDEWSGMTEDDQIVFLDNVNDSVNENSIALADNRVIQETKNIHVNIDADPSSEIVLSDIDGDGVIDVKSVDLNNDGHIDVIHSTRMVKEEISETDNVVNEASIDYKETDGTIELDIHIKSNKDNPIFEGLEESLGHSENSIPILEPIERLDPIIGFSDTDNDGIYDAAGIDNDHDGYADVVQIDVNQDSYIDIEAHNIDGDDDLDIIIIDEGQNGIDDTDNMEEIDEVIRMDEFMIIEEEGELEADQMIEETDNSFLEDNDMDITLEEI